LSAGGAIGEQPVVQRFLVRKDEEQLPGGFGFGHKLKGIQSGG